MISGIKMASLPLVCTSLLSTVQYTLQEHQDPQEPPSRPSSSQVPPAPQVPSTGLKMRATTILATLGALLLISSSASAVPLVIKLEFSDVFNNNNNNNNCGERGDPCSYSTDCYRINCNFVIGECF
ncbi:MAG: hypothetical protein JOS17DRAFT_201357 [Linnemannia elongata]|nr:MAG: hypothetical protein JOS17DRAFT_201357 [Linnemannia elongata]